MTETVTREPASRQAEPAPLEARRALSIVIPSYNEAESLPELFRRLADVAVAQGYALDIVLVDDGSSDGTAGLVTTLPIDRESSLTYVRSRSNIGKSAALMEGISRTRADTIVTMDADLQDQPEELPKLLEGLDQGFDVVSGWKRARRDPLLGKKIPSRVFNFLTRRLLGSKLQDINSGFKAYRREVWESIRIYGELHRFIPVLAANAGYRVTEVAVAHSPRRYGSSKYGASRFVKGVFDILTVFFLRRYTFRPLHFFGLVGSLLIFIGMLGNVYLGIVWLGGQSIGTRPLLLVSTLMIVIGIQILLFGLLAQLVIDLSGERGGRSVTVRQVKRPSDDAADTG